MCENILYKNKYLKYKEKYLLLKKQIGGSNNKYFELFDFAKIEQIHKYMKLHSTFSNFKSILIPPDINHLNVKLTMRSEIKVLNEDQIVVIKDILDQPDSGKFTDDKSKMNLINELLKMPTKLYPSKMIIYETYVLVYDNNNKQSECKIANDIYIKINDIVKLPDNTILIDNKNEINKILTFFTKLPCLIDVDHSLCKFILLYYQKLDQNYNIDMFIYDDNMKQISCKMGGWELSSYFSSDETFQNYFLKRAKFQR
jgi:hypothetical protein